MIKVGDKLTLMNDGEVAHETKVLHMGPLADDNKWIVCRDKYGRRFETCGVYVYSPPVGGLYAKTWGIAVKPPLEVLAEELCNLAFQHPQGITIMPAKLTEWAERIERLGRHGNEIVEALMVSPFDVAPCKSCNRLTVCLPDGLPFCEECGSDNGEKITEVNSDSSSSYT